MCYIFVVVLKIVVFFIKNTYSPADGKLGTVNPIYVAKYVCLDSRIIALLL